MMAILTGVRFQQTFQEELIPTLLKLFHEIERKEHCQNPSVKPLLHSSQNWIRTQQKRGVIGQSL
jgi:hypothetical protein